MEGLNWCAWRARGTGSWAERGQARASPGFHPFSKHCAFRELGGQVVAQTAVPRLTSPESSKTTSTCSWLRMRCPWQSPVPFLPLSEQTAGSVCKEPIYTERFAVALISLDWKTSRKEGRIPPNSPFHSQALFQSRSLVSCVFILGSCGFS